MSWDAFQERIFLESQLERRLQFFLFFFIGTIVISLIISQKEIAMIFLVVAVIVCWLLTVSLWFFVNRINSADKNLAATAGTGPKFMERTLRFFLAKVLPVTASVILTIFLMVGVSGIADSILPYKQKAAEVIEKGKDKIENSFTRKSDGSYFESVDSVIEKGKSAPKKGAEITFDNYTVSDQKEILADIPEEKSGGIVKPAPKKVNVIYAVDGSHQAPKQGEEATRDNVSSSPTNTQAVNSAQKPDPHFAPVEKVIEKTPAETKVVSTKVIPLTKKDSLKKKIQTDPNFKDIEKVIKK